MSVHWAANVFIDAYKRTITYTSRFAILPVTVDYYIYSHHIDDPILEPIEVDDAYDCYD